MPATSDSIDAVFAALGESHPEWPYSADRDTVGGDPWPLAWDAAAFTEEWFTHPEHTDIEEAICHLPLDPWKFGYEITDWHSKRKPRALLRAHLLRIVKGWGGETALVNYLDDEPELVAALGFEDGLASKSTLWRVWNDGRFSPKHKSVLRTIGQVLVNVAREHDLPAPDEVFHPEPDIHSPEAVKQDSTTVRDRVIANIENVWPHAKPMLTENYTVPRDDNTEIHENAFLEAHAYIGSREEMYAEDGTWNFAAETTRDRVQTGSTHRYHIQKIDPGEAREMHRAVTKELIERARRDSELVGGVTVAIDITKSNPYRENTELEFDGNGNLTNKWLLGYKKDAEKDDDDSLPDIHFQWASVQIVGLDVPLVLDAVPIYRGFSRAAIVDTLLESATEMVDVELVLMDREFSGTQVKNVCEEHEVHYLVPGQMRSSERATCTRLRRQEKLVHIQRETGSRSKGEQRTTLSDFVGDQEADEEVEDPIRKQVFVPAMNANRTSDDSAEGDNEDSETTGDEEDDERSEVRQEMLEDFAEVTDADAEDVGRMFEDVIEEEYEWEEERDLPGKEEDTKLYILFETNHPDLELIDGDDDGVDELKKAHMAARVVRRYKHRWAIENGFKQIKNFRVRTTSMKYEYRFFNFLYACTLYNVWRLVDTLVKLELQSESEFKYKPLVTADLFLTIAKGYIGLDPPD